MDIEISTTLDELDETEELIERARQLTAPASREELDAAEAVLRLRNKATEVEADVR